MNPASPSPAIDVFLSYARNDGELRDALVKHLALLQHQGVIKAWHDRNIDAGTDWKEAAHGLLNQAGIVLLLVSADFLASDYCYELEMKQAVARHEAGLACVIPVILRAVDWHSAVFGKLKALPSNEKPITSWPNRDEALANVAEGIRAVAEKLRAAEASKHEIPPSKSTHAPADEDAEPLSSLPKTPARALSDVIAHLNKMLAGQHKVLELVGRGETALVFRGADLVLDRQVAIKVLDPYKAAHDASVRERFDMEIKLVADLKHRNIVAVYTGRLEPPLPHIVMEFVHGVRLDKLIARVGNQPLRKVRDFVIQMGSALNYAHQKGHIHHHLHPANIMVDREGQPVISPFRMASGPDSCPRGKKMLPLEDIKYQSPEQYQFEEGDVEISEASDQYSLGLIAYEMLIGRPVITANTFGGIRKEKELFMKSTPELPKNRPGCPQAFVDVILRMLSVHSKDRWPYLEDACEALRDCNLDGSLQRNSAEYHAMHEAMRSFERCRKSPMFFEDFYGRFFGLYPDMRERFPGNLEEQYYLLREALDLILQFPAESQSAPSILSRVAESHESRGIHPELYDSFTRLLMETVKAHDPRCRSESAAVNVLEAWDKTITPAMDYMKGKWRTR